MTTGGRDPIQEQVYGRADLVDAVARSRASLTLVTGDSGAGKSTVLWASQRVTPGALAPGPRMLRFSGGALQRGLLAALAGALSQAASDPQSATEVARYLFDGARRLASETMDELPSVVAREVLALARGQVGEDVGKAVTEFVRNLATPVDERLAAQVAAAAEPSVAEVAIRLADEVRDFADAEYLVAALDGGERLTWHDLRVLADLAADLPDRLRLRLAFSTYTSEYRDRADFLLRSGEDVVEHAVEGLSVESVGEWLDAEGLDETGATSVRRATAGYPLHVGDMIAHLREGGDVEDAPLNRLFARRTEEAWQALDRDSSRHARALSVLRDPLPQEQMRDLLGLDVAAWGDLEDRLWRPRIFSVEVDGQRWFHEQRRQHLIENVLTDAEKEQAATEAARALYALVNSTESSERLPELSELVESSEQLQAENAQIKAAVTMDVGELALAAALIETVDPLSSLPAMEADLLLRYTRSVFGTEEDLVDALRRLGDREGVLVQEAGGRAVVVPFWNTGLGVATIAGRAARELSRPLVPRAATAVFGLELQGRLGRFRDASYGLGRPSFGSLSAFALDQRKESTGAEIVIARPDPGANLLLRGRHAGRGFYAAVTYDSPAERDAAHARIDGLSGEVFGQDYSVEDVLAHPVDPVPSRRFLEAAERVVGRSLGHPFSSSKPSLRLSTPVDPEEAIHRKASVIQVVRASSSWLERLATQTEEPLAYAFYAQDDFVIEAPVRGGREGVVRVASPPRLSSDDPYSFFRLAEAIGLLPEERLTSFRVGGGPNHNDPAVAALAAIFEEAHSFNESQGVRRSVVFEEKWLEQQLTEVARQRLDDARALASTPAFGEGATAPEPRTTYLAIELEPPQTGWVHGAHSLASYVFAPSMDGEERVRVAIVPKAPSGGVPVGVSADFRELFGLERAETLNGGSGDLRSILAGMLGYLTAEVEFEYPPEVPSA